MDSSLQTLSKLCICTCVGIHATSVSGLMCESCRSFITGELSFYGLIETNLWTHIFLVIFILFALLICHDDTDPQGVKDGVVPVRVVWSRAEYSKSDHYWCR